MQPVDQTPLFIGDLSVCPSHRNTFLQCCTSFVNLGGPSTAALRASAQEDKEEGKESALTVFRTVVGASRDEDEENVT
jgi:hypothetical protein